jgi:hypothetical protein
MLKLYELQNKESDIQISLTLAQMLKNSFIEEELLDIGINDIPDSLRTLPPDGNGWPYKKQPSAAFSYIDRKMREDISSVFSPFNEKRWGGNLTVYYDGEKANLQFSTLSFKTLFPSFLNYLQSLKNNDTPPEHLLNTIGYNTPEKSDEIHTLCKQVQKDSSLSLEYAFKGADSHSGDSFKETKGQKWIKGIAASFILPPK